VRDFQGEKGATAARNSGRSCMWAFLHLQEPLFINSAKKRNVPFSGPCPSKIIHKNPNIFTYLHCKVFKHDFPCLFNEP
jgi:hypothetical protein